MVDAVLPGRTRQAAGFGQRQKEFQVVPVHGQLRIHAHPLRKTAHTAEPAIRISPAMLVKRRARPVRSHGVVMRKFFSASVALTVVAAAAFPAAAQMTEDSAGASLAPFYKALNAAYVNDAPEL